MMLNIHVELKSFDCKSTSKGTKCELSMLVSLKRRSSTNVRSKGWLHRAAAMEIVLRWERSRSARGARIARGASRKYRKSAGVPVVPGGEAN